MPLIIEMFPEEYLELQRELVHHPVLVELLQKHNGDPHIDVRIMEICVYLHIIVEGTYSQQDFNNLARICTKKLKEMRQDLRGLTIVHEMPKDLQ